MLLGQQYIYCYVCKLKYKTKHSTKSKTVPISNQIRRNRGTLETPTTDLHDRSLSLLGTMKNRWVKLTIAYEWISFCSCALLLHSSGHAADINFLSLVSRDRRSNPRLLHQSVFFYFIINMFTIWIMSLLFICVILTMYMLKCELNKVVFS